MKQADWKIIFCSLSAIFFAMFNQIASAAKAIKQLRYSGKKYAATLDEAHLVGSSGGLEGVQFYLFRPASCKLRFLQC